MKASMSAQISFSSAGNADSIYNSNIIHMGRFTIACLHFFAIGYHFFDIYTMWAGHGFRHSPTQPGRLWHAVRAPKNAGHGCRSNVLMAPAGFFQRGKNHRGMKG
jgi:hypothetical protein